ncbi:hypothetical protein A6A06_11770 [Streptomyces sp. CB02923]|uniref:hypothetical protein n=1 Tax=Streptomyces sp. CB02923 TaxID=1718985 RepID=UPI00093EF27A|nr:hypothetical protein [Streptomyces sp. CB02923]OKI05291.1 hypothetical protein A6A06_11770 [Streptomyces sp. CB02923]
MSGPGQAVPPGAAAAAVPAQSPVPLALGMPDRNSWLILIGFLVVLVLLIWLLARTVRRQGGLRRTCRRVAWEVRMTARAFTAPLRAYLRHRRCARTLAAYFADPAAYDVSRAALDRADADAGDGCYAPTVQLSPAWDRVHVVVAGRDPAGAPGPLLPWAGAAEEPGEWTWSARADAVRGPSVAHGRAVRLPLVLGVDRKATGVVLVDWLRGPAALGVEGDPQVSRSVLQALAAQVDRLPDGPPVLVTPGVHPRFPGRSLDDVLAELAADRWAAPGQGIPDVPEIPDATAVPVVVCWAPTADQAARLADLCARGRARALVGGRLPGACWVLHAESDGRLLGPGPRVDVESPALGGAVARAVKRRQPAPHCVLPGAGMGTGTGTGTGTGMGPDSGYGAPAEPVWEPAPAMPDLRKPEPEPEQDHPTSPLPPQPQMPQPQAQPMPAAWPAAPPPAYGPPGSAGPHTYGAPHEAPYEAPPAPVAFDADFAEPAPGAPAPATAPAQPGPVPAQRPDAPAPHGAAAHSPAASGTPADAGAGADFAEPDLAEPRAAAAPPGLSGVSAAGTSDADSDPADPQERTPRTP